MLRGPLGWLGLLEEASQRGAQLTWKDGPSSKGQGRWQTDSVSASPPRQPLLPEHPAQTGWGDEVQGLGGAGGIPRWTQKQHPFSPALEPSREMPEQRRTGWVVSPGPAAAPGPQQPPTPAGGQTGVEKAQRSKQQLVGAAAPLIWGAVWLRG